MPRPESAKRRVEKGAKFLDRNVPDWYNGRHKIDLECLDLSSPSSCVLGQVYKINGYSRGLVRLKLDDAQAMAYGFEAYGVISRLTLDDEYALLTRHWRREIRSRRKKAGI